MDSMPRSESASKLAIGLWLTDQTLMRLRLAAAVGWTVVIMLLCWMPRGVVREAARIALVRDPASRQGRPRRDLCRFCDFVAASADGARGRYRYAWVALGGLLLAVVTELGQLIEWVGRDASIGDTLTDAAGLLVGLVVAPLLEPRLRLVESRLFRATDVPASPASARPARVTSEERSPSST